MTTLDGFYIDSTVQNPYGSFDCKSYLAVICR